MSTSHTALVTGGTGGLGQAITRALHDQGHTVLVAHSPGNDHVPAWLRAQAKRGLLTVDDAEAASDMLLGMLAFQPQRAVMFGHAPVPTREDIERRAGACAKLFLQGCAG